MKTRSLMALMMAASMFALTACGGAAGAGNNKSQADSKTAAKKEYTPAKVRVAYMPNLGSASSLFTAMDQGYFEEVGLTVEPSEFGGGPAEIAAMASGDIDISQIGHGAHALCIEGKAKIFQMDSTTSLADELVANKSRGISSTKDLKGKTVAVSSGTSSEIILQQALKKAGLKESDVNLVEMSVDGMTTAMVSEKVDACAIWSPNTVTLKKALGDNYLTLGNNADFLDQAIFPASFITTDDFAKKNEDVLVRFSQAINKAHVYRSAHIDEVAKKLAKRINAPEETMLQSTKEGDWDTINTIAGDNDKIKTVYETQQKVFISGGRFKEPVDTNNYVLYDLMKKSYDAFQASK